VLEKFDLSDLGLSTSAPHSFRLNSAWTAVEGVFRPAIALKELGEEFGETVGLPSEEFPLSTRIFEFDKRASDEAVVHTAEKGLPLIVNRDAEVAVNFDILATRSFLPVLDGRGIAFTGSQ
jgi:hypothetical protein